MTDQPTTTERAAANPEPEMAEQPDSAEQRASGAQPAPSEQQAPRAQPTVTEQPMGTRELRDAQASGQRVATQGRGRRSSETHAQQRPPIRATGVGSGVEVRQKAPLFDESAGRALRERWLVIQTEFVDEPREAVQKADALVAEVLKQLTDTFAREREDLEAGWSGSGDGGDGSPREISTEDLRQAIQRYRSFFNRLLTL